MNTYARVRESRLSGVAQRVGEMVLQGQSDPKRTQSPNSAESENAATRDKVGDCGDVAPPPAAGTKPELQPQAPPSSRDRRANRELHEEPVLDSPELTHLTAAWTDLNPALRAGILAMVNSAKS